MLHYFPASSLTTLPVMCFTTRRPCLHASTYSAPSTGTESPIRVADKSRSRRRIKNVFIDDRGYPDQSNEFDVLLQNIDGGPVLCKLKHQPPPLDSADPTFMFPFDEALHGERLRKDLDLSHLDAPLQQSIYALIQKYRSVFDDCGVFVPVRDYECVIDTGNAHPIAVKKIMYGLNELPIMQRAVAALEKVGHIRQICDGRWLFKAVLAPKPHQEHIRHIQDFVWHFCVNYVPLNSVTRIIAYPIPRCNAAVSEEFGTGQWLWLFDAPSGYHQLAVAQDSQEKLAFQGPDAIKYTYTVMPFGPTNGPATFINFIFDVDSQWKSLACTMGITIDDGTNTCIIVDNIISHGQSLPISMLYMECQLRVALAYRLSLSLRKSYIFPRRFEFVGNDVCPDGNRPAQSKHQLLQLWPTPEIVHDVAKFIGFAQFYRTYIHHFELRIQPLCNLTIKCEYTKPVATIWTDECTRSFNDVRNAILSDPCLLRYNRARLVILRSDFSSIGFGYVVCQPATDEASEAAMTAYRAGSDFSFMNKESSVVVQPVAFGGRRCRGNEVRLHSHLGECFAGDWAINKNRHMLFGQRFVWVTDCYAARFILSYDGNNPAVLRLQMRLKCWDVDIVHGNDTHLTDADYWSRLGADICFDPLFKSYLDFDRGLCARCPAPSALPMKPENMPYYRGPRFTGHDEASEADAPSESPPEAAKGHALYCKLIYSAMFDSNCHGLSHLAHIPVQFGHFDHVAPANSFVSSNYELPAAANQIMNFNWAVYSFGGGHFLLTIPSRNLPFHVMLACDQYDYGRALFSEFASNATVLWSSADLLHHLCSSRENGQIHGYLIHSFRFRDSETAIKFWQVQATIIAQLRSLRNLQVVIAVIISDHDGRCICSFRRTLENAGWILSSHDGVSFLGMGDSVAGSCDLLLGVHSACMPTVDPIELKMPPPVPPRPIAQYLWEPFNRTEHSVCFGQDDDDFCRQDVRFTASDPPHGTPIPSGVLVKYYIHGQGMDESILCGAAVIAVDGMCAPFDATVNQNMFRHLFGVEFHHDNHTHVRGISPFEFARCFGFVDSLTYRLSHPSCTFALDSAVPQQTSTWIFDQVHAYMVLVRDSNCELFSPTRWAAPATTIQSFINGTIGTSLPSHNRWVAAYGSDAACVRIRDLVLNPGKICKSTLMDVHYVYRQPLRQSHIIIEGEMLIFREPIRGSTSYTRLQIVPVGLCDILFVAFQTQRGPFIGSGYAIIGLKCTRTSSECAMPALAVRC